MPRKVRIDAHGALHHIILRGIERRKIFYDNADRENFLNRLENYGGSLHLTFFMMLLSICARRSLNFLSFCSFGKLWARCSGVDFIKIYFSLCYFISGLGFSNLWNKICRNLCLYLLTCQLESLRELLLRNRPVCAAEMKWPFGRYCMIESVSYRKMDRPSCLFCA